MKTNPLHSLVLIVLVLLISGCAPQSRAITYIYQNPTIHAITHEGTEVLIEVRSSHPDRIQKFLSRRYIITHAIMESRNITLDEANEILFEQYDRTMALSEKWKDVVSVCIDCDMTYELEQSSKKQGSENKSSKFLDMKLSSIDETVNNGPHLGYWEYLLFDFTNKEFREYSANVEAILSKYDFLPAVHSDKKIVSYEALTENHSFYLHEFFMLASMIQINHDETTTIITDGNTENMLARDIKAYDFMKIPWFSNNFEGTEFRTAAGFDNVVVPWNYCIKGHYQEQRTGYWASCSRVSLRIYDMFGDYKSHLPELATLNYKIVQSGYYVKSGLVSSQKLIDLMESTMNTLEIPTPFDLNTFRIGNGFDGLLFSEERQDGTTKEYDITKTDDSGFYLRIRIDKEGSRQDQSFTFFYSDAFDLLYESLLKQ